MLSHKEKREGLDSFPFFYWEKCRGSLNHCRDKKTPWSGNSAKTLAKKFLVIKTIMHMARLPLGEEEGSQEEKILANGPIC